MSNGLFPSTKPPPGWLKAQEARARQRAIKEEIERIAHKKWEEEKARKENERLAKREKEIRERLKKEKEARERKERKEREERDRKEKERKEKEKHKPTGTIYMPQEVIVPSKSGWKETEIGPVSYISSPYASPETLSRDAWRTIGGLSDDLYAQYRTREAQKFYKAVKEEAKKRDKPKPKSQLPRVSVPRIISLPGQIFEPMTPQQMGVGPVALIPPYPLIYTPPAISGSPWWAIGLSDDESIEHEEAEHRLLNVILISVAVVAILCWRRK